MKDAIAMQHTGGRDSTLASLLMADEYRKIFLITFRHSLVEYAERSCLNVQKLKLICGKSTEFEHDFLDVENLFRKILISSYPWDILNYGLYWSCSPCGACRLAQHTYTILFCLENGIHYAADGANRTGFDLSQNSYAIEHIEGFYKEYGITYQRPIYNVESSDIELLKYGIENDVSTVFYGSQPECMGGGEFHNTILRSVLLPLHKRKGYEKIMARWLEAKIDVCRKYIEEKWTADKDHINDISECCSRCCIDTHSFHRSIVPASI